MKNTFTLLIGIILVLVLMGVMFTYSVGYDEVAVVATFDRAAPPEYDEDGVMVDPGSLVQDAGLKWKLPPPIQSVRTYPKTVQLLEDEPEQLQTADGHSVIVSTYLTWRIEDPYAFYRSLEDVGTAERRLNSFLSDVKGVITAYNFGQLVNTDPAKMKLAQIERQCAEELRARLAKTNYGIRIEQVGIRKIVPPEATTNDIFERMRQTRQRLAQSALTEGDAQASTIRSEADSARRRLLAFAERRAQAIRDKGNREAASYYAAFRDDPETDVNEEELAVFLRQLEAMKLTLAHNTTFILDAEMEPFNMFRDGPTMPTVDLPAKAGEPSADTDGTGDEQAAAANPAAGSRQ